MPVRKLKEFLDENHIRYEVIIHAVAYPAQEIAAKSHIRGKELAKSVMIKIDGTMAMAVLPASEKVDLTHLKEITGAGKVELASEYEFKNRFPDCEPGAMPPFGNLYNMAVFASETLSEDEEIAFNAGTHTELIKLNYADFERLVQPTVLELSMHYKA